MEDTNWDEIIRFNKRDAFFSLDIIEDVYKLTTFEIRISIDNAVQEFKNSKDMGMFSFKSFDKLIIKHLKPIPSREFGENLKENSSYDKWVRLLSKRDVCKGLIKKLSIGYWGETNRLTIDYLNRFKSDDEALNELILELEKISGYGLASLKERIIEHYHLY